MGPKSSAAYKKFPDRQPTVSPDPDDAIESGSLATGAPEQSIQVQTPRRMDDERAFSKAQLSTLNGIIKASVQRAIREELMPQMQDLLTKQLSTFHLQEPLVDQSIAHRQQFLPPLPPSLSSNEYETDRRVRLEDVGIFDPPTNTFLLGDAATSQGKYTPHHDVFSFTDTLKLYGEEVCKGLFWKSCLRGQALNWWLTELPGHSVETAKSPYKPSVDVVQARSVLLTFQALWPLRQSAICTER
ncbi:hypothetical protein V8E51_007745 [Hyaloscypha variabilis]